MRVYAESFACRADCEVGKYRHIDTRSTSRYQEPLCWIIVLLGHFFTASGYCLTGIFYMRLLRVSQIHVPQRPTIGTKNLASVIPKVRVALSCLASYSDSVDLLVEYHTNGGGGGGLRLATSLGDIWCEIFYRPDALPVTNL